MNGTTSSSMSDVPDDYDNNSTTAVIEKNNEATVASLTTMNLDSYAAGTLNMHKEEDYEIINSQTR